MAQSFIDDKEKMVDFWMLDKEEFLQSYSYLTEEEYDATAAEAHNRGENFTVKQLQKSKKSIETKLKKLNDQSRKDDLVTFEELGVDRLFIDESHYYKNRAKRCA